MIAGDKNVAKNIQWFCQEPQVSFTWEHQTIH